MEVSLPHEHHALRVWRDDGAYDLGPRVLVGLAKITQSDLQRGRRLGRHLEPIVWKINPVRRL